MVNLSFAIDNMMVIVCWANSNVIHGLAASDDVTMMVSWQAVAPNTEPRQDCQLTAADYDVPGCLHGHSSCLDSLLGCHSHRRNWLLAHQLRSGTTVSGSPNRGGWTPCVLSAKELELLLRALLRATLPQTC